MRSAVITAGKSLAPDKELIVRRGAVTVAFDPIFVTWKEECVPLSPTEAHVYAHVCRRGRTTLKEIEDVMLKIGAAPATRALVLGHIRGKFMRLGACDPFERLGKGILRVRVDPDARGSTGVVVGLSVPRYAVAP